MGKGKKKLNKKELNKVAGGNLMTPQQIKLLINNDQLYKAAQAVEAYDGSTNSEVRACENYISGKYGQNKCNAFMLDVAKANSQEYGD